MTVHVAPIILKDADVTPNRRAARLAFLPDTLTHNSTRIMAKHLFVSGHGGWKPDYGYTQVPRGLQVNFYTHFAKNLMTGMEYKILAGTYTEKDRSIGQYSQCPDMRVSGQPDDWTAKSEANLSTAFWGAEAAVIGVPEGEAAHLSELFSAMSGHMSDAGITETIEIHWLACSTLQLKKAGGSKFGVNAEDFGHHTDKPGRYRITAGNKQIWK